MRAAMNASAIRSAMSLSAAFRRDFASFSLEASFAASKTSSPIFAVLNTASTAFSEAFT